MNAEQVDEQGWRRARWLALVGCAVVAGAVSFAPLGAVGQGGGEGAGAPPAEGSGTHVITVVPSAVDGAFAAEGSGSGSGLVAPVPGGAQAPPGPGGPWLGAEPAPDSDFSGAADDGGTLLPDRRGNAPDGFPF